MTYNNKKQMKSFILKNLSDIILLQRYYNETFSYVSNIIENDCSLFFTHVVH